MTSRDFLKPKSFKLKPKSFSFKSVEFMTDLEKEKLYKNFVKFLNNHFKKTAFKKDMYQHFTCHCGFSAHYNIHGFYGEYFETAAKFHFNVNNYENAMSEYSGNLNSSSSLSHGEQFYAIYEEINGSRSGLGEFFDGLMTNQNFGGYSDYKDLDDALKDAISEYLEVWREEIRKSIKAYDKFLKNEEVAKLKAEKEAKKEAAQKLLIEADQIEKELVDKKTTQDKIELKKEVKGQTTLFDFMDVA